MLEKRATYNITDIQPLNKPDFSESIGSFYQDQDIPVNDKAVEFILKLATSKESSEKNSDGQESPLFDLESEIKNHPDSLFIKCFAIKAAETNDNGDYFSEEELMKAVPSFVGVPLFTNHANSDINEARGKVVHSWWDHERNGIMIVGRVDAAAYPQLARGIKEDYVVGTSMGCQVAHSLCSVCHNHAETPDQYCSCIQERKTRQVNAKNQECNYHKNGEENECPICSCKKGETKKYSVSTQVFEYNYGIKFIENSFVVNPACSDCGITEIIDPSKFLAKVAEISKILPKLLKAAETQPLACTDQQCIKIAGQQELDSLNQALDLVSSVSQDMLNQKEQIDLEFLSDLVKVLADLQAVIDELTEQGYGRLQSPGQAPEPGQSPAGMDQGGPEITNSVSPVNPTSGAGGGGSKVTSGPAGQVGNVTSPLASKKILSLEKEAINLLKIQKNITIPEFNIGKIKDSPQIKIASKPSNKQIDLSFQIRKSTS